MTVALPCPYQGKFGKPIPGSLPTIVGSFKFAATKRINIIRNAPKTPVWQHNYYERIIRDKSSLPKVRHYIQMNPIAWDVDQSHPHNCCKE
jgi:putative transposase